MQRKREKFFIYNIAFGEIFLLVLAIFSFAFMISEVSFVGAAFGAINLPTQTPGGPGLLETLYAIPEGGFFETFLPQSAAPGELVAGGVPSHLLGAAFWAVLVGGLTYLAVRAFGGSVQAAQTSAYATGAGTFVGAFAYFQASGFVAGKDVLFAALLKNSWLAANPAGGALIIGVAIAIVVFVALYRKESKQIVQFQCNPWEPPIGGSQCETCNEDPLKPCTEYRCKSLGQACDLVNKGSVEEKCVWINPRDALSPTMTPWQGALSEEHRYTNHDTRPPSLGTKIVRTNQECIRPFTPLEFGLETNEPAQCKIDLETKESFDEMDFFFGGNTFFRTNHTERMRLPSPETLEEAGNGTFILGADGRYNFYARCRDANGNTNEEEFVFSFCVDPSPDTTPPVIEDTSIIPGSPVSSGIGEVDLSIFVNEPATCKWSIQDKAYEDMETEMTCATEVYEQNAQQLYQCQTILTGIQDREENNFYFRCKDQPLKEESERNVNSQSYEFTLRGSQELNIISASPGNETITGSTNVVQVDLELETSNGAEEGQAVCYYSPNGGEDTYLKMFETDNFEHRQTLSLTGGNYNFFFRCVDRGGNSDETSVNFDVFVDTTSPQVTRAYRELDALKVVTNEDAQCTYSLNNCNFVFEEGINMLQPDIDKKTQHFIEWDPNTVYYIKCQDEFANQPSPNQCSLIVSATSV